VSGPAAAPPPARLDLEPKPLRHDHEDVRLDRQRILTLDPQEPRAREAVVDGRHRRPDLEPQARERPAEFEPPARADEAFGKAQEFDVQRRDQRLEIRPRLSNERLVDRAGRHPMGRCQGCCLFGVGPSSVHCGSRNMQHIPMRQCP
jgi:hypothetical protein